MLTINLIKETWTIILAFSLPISGLVGFVVHILTIKKSALEVTKLQYEVDKLKSEIQNKNRLIEIANFDQIIQYASEKKCYHFLPTIIEEYRSRKKIISPEEQEESNNAIIKDIKQLLKKLESEGILDEPQAIKE